MIQPTPAATEGEVPDAAWYYRLADELKRRGNLIGAIRAYQALLEIDPGEIRARYLLANILARQHDWLRAIQEYSRVLEGRPDYVQARHKLGLALRALQRLRESYQTLVECARLQPRDGSIFLSLGIVLTDLGQLRYAVHAFARAAQLVPDDPQAHYRLGRALISLAMPKPRSAPGSGRSSSTASGKPPAMISACFISSSKTIRQPSQHFEAILQHTPDDMEAAYLLALGLKETGRLDESVRWLERVVEVRPALFMAHFHLGATLLRLGTSAKGLQHMRCYEQLKHAQSEVRT